jgi:hypothetical protein
MKHYRVTIEDELTATSPRQALSNTLQRIRREETVAAVTCLESGEVEHFEIQTGESLEHGDRTIDPYDVPVAPV